MWSLSTGSVLCYRGPDIDAKGPCHPPSTAPNFRASLPSASAQGTLAERLRAGLALVRCAHVSKQRLGRVSANPVFVG